MSAPQRIWIDPIRYAWRVCHPRIPFPAALDNFICDLRSFRGAQRRRA